MSESYTIGGNKFQDLGGSKYGAQTFMPLKEHVLQYIDLELDSQEKGLRPNVDLHFADAFGNPVPPPISWHRGATGAPNDTRIPYRCRVDMRERRLYPAISYVIVAHCPEARHAFSLRWQYDKDVSAYPRGIRLHSGDHGETWSPDPYDDHIFAEFGNPPLFKVPHNPPPLYWALVHIEHNFYSTSACYRFGTSSPVTMTLHVTENEPKPMETFRVTRGYKHRCLEYYAFNSWRTYLQMEKSDSIYHTFHVGGLKEGQRYWMVNTAESDLNPSISISPLLARTHPGGPPFTTIRRPDAPGDRCQIDWQIGDPCPNHYLNVDEASSDEEETLVATRYSSYYRKDLYHIPALEISHDGVPFKEVHITARWRRQGGMAYVHLAKIGIKVNGVEWWTPAYNEIKDFYKNEHLHLYENPITGLPWTYAELNTLQIGVALRHYRGVGWGSHCRVTQLFCIIKHKCEAFE